MYTLDFNKPIKVHFIGIGGVSMSGLAKLLLSKGFAVQGSDRQKSAVTKELEELGATVFLGQRAGNITEDIDLVVYTAAVKSDNEELMEVRNRNIPELTRSELLGQVMLQYDTPVSIAGTHGKTTTTSMLSVVLMQADMDPTISVGGDLPQINGNFRVGHGKHFVVESCEYTNSFLDFHPSDAIILNVDADHLDFFKDIDDIRCSFRKFADLVPETGLLMVNSEIPEAENLFENVKAQCKFYGLAEDVSDVNKYDYAAANITYNEQGCGTFEVYENGQLLGQITLGTVGRHNVSNALPVVAMAKKYGVPFEKIQEGLLAFTGTKRRFEYKGSLGEIKIYDDYAHHPAEITATLTSAMKYKKNRVITVFQPHTYTRTKALLNEFAEALSISDVVVLADIYAAREVNTVGVSSDDIRVLIQKNGKEAYYLPTFDEIENFLLEFSTSGDLLITMGAGDIVKVGEHLLGL